MAREFIVEADGGSRGNPGPAAYGALLRDPASGEILVEIAEYIGTASNNVAEYRGLIAGLILARDFDATARVEVRMDSKLVVEQMSGRWQIKHPAMRPLALEARGILPPGQVKYGWIPRERNKDADRLANEALDAAAAGRSWQAKGSRAPSTPSPRGRQAAEVDEGEIDAGPQNAQPDQVGPKNAIVGWADLGPPTKFVLLRHGETEHTVERVFSGSGGEDPPLTEVGHEQAELAGNALVARLKGASWHGMTTAHTVVCSPLRRARETAEIVAGHLGVSLVVETRLAECSFGSWEGSTLAEVQREWPEELARWLASPDVAPPGGESYTALATRVRAARDDLLSRYPRHTLIVVSHVSPIKSLVREAVRAPAESMYRLELDPASFTMIDWYADGNASLRTFNETSHLR